MAIAQKSEGSSFQSSVATNKQNTAAQSGQRYTPQQQGFLDKLFPQLNQQFGQINPQQPFGDRLSAVGGPQQQFTPVPFTQSFTPEQIGMKTNQMFSDAGTQTAGQVLDNNRNAAGRGYASSSPVLAALNQQAQGQGYRTAQENATNFELGAAQQNSEIGLQSRLAQLGVEQAMSSDDLKRRQLALQQQGYDVQQQNTILQAMNINLRPLQSSSSQSSGSGRTVSSGGSRQESTTYA